MAFGYMFNARSSGIDVDSSAYSGHHHTVDKRLRWFDEGASMLRLVAGRLNIGDQLPDHEEYYACPCCLVAYNRAAVIAGVLTEEHVPPEGVGGRGLLLTCKNCNNSSGKEFDSHAVTRLDADDFTRGRVNGRTLPVTSYAAGIPLRGTAQWTEDGIQIFGVPRQNNPKEQAAHLAALDVYVESRDPRPNHSFTIRTRYSETRARISWIRSAYLAAFAALGWSYIFQSVMEPYRRQMAEPDEEVVPTYILRDVDAPSDLRRILIVTEPDDLRSVAVVMGEHTVFLPGIPMLRPQTCVQLVSACKSRADIDQNIKVNLSGKVIPWPRWPTYLLDRQE